MGPLQLAIHVVGNRHAGEQKSLWDETNKGNYHLKLFMLFLCLVPVRTFALYLRDFVPREWLAAKGLLFLSTGTGRRMFDT